MMITGTGIDIMSVARVRTAITRTAGFETTVFAPEEISYCRSMRRWAEHFAARFAAKEAVMKALGTGWAGGIRFRDIVIQNRENGRPYVEIREPTRSLIPGIGAMRIMISMSHDRENAVAHAIISVDESYEKNRATR